MLRMQDFRCPMDGPFEITLNLDPADGDARFDAVRSQPCPTCGEASPGIWTKAPATRMGDRVHVVDLGGRTHTRDSIEEALDQNDKPKNFYDEPDFEGKFLHTAARVIQQHMNGEIAPPDRAELPDGADAGLARAAANVDVDAVKASQDAVTTLLRTTEFPE